MPNFKISRERNSFSALYYFLKVHLHHFSKIKSHKEVTKHLESRLFLLCFLKKEGSGAGSVPLANRSGRPKNNTVGKKMNEIFKLDWPDPGEAQKYTDPTNPDPDPQHSLELLTTTVLTINAPVVYMGRDILSWMRGNP
jgi:hypothetical protein